MKNTTTYELKIILDHELSGQEDILVQYFIGVGIPLQNIAVSQVNHQRSISYLTNDFSSIRSLKKELNRLQLINSPVQVNKIHSDDWRLKWKKDFKPFDITKSVTIVPAWLRNNYKNNGKTLIYVDTDMAFGTGLHATTRLMAQFIENYVQRNYCVLDIGTGTGILAILAEKCGCNHIDAFDLESDAVKVAKKNIKRNNCSKINVFTADANCHSANQTYDFVAANLITHDLLNIQRALLKLTKPGKFCAVSGISLNSYKMFRQKFSMKNWRCVKISKSEGWVALLFKRKQAKK